MIRISKMILRGLVYLALIIGALIMLGPFLWMILATLKTEAELLTFPPALLPAQFTLENYRYVFESLPLFPRYIFNSIFVTLSVVILNVFLDALAAFAFAMLDFPGRDKIFLLFMVSLLLPLQVVIIPLFRLISDLGWVDSYWALIIPGATSAFGIFLLRQYMRTLSPELLDAARIDGASNFTAFWHIFLPLCRPALATLAVFVFMESWNSFVWPLIVTNADEMRTLTVGVALLQGMNEMHWTWLITASLISLIPMLIFYIFMQRNFIEGLTAGAVKG